MGFLGVGFLSWLNCRKSIRRLAIGKNDTFCFGLVEFFVIIIIVMWLFFRLGRIEILGYYWFVSFL